MIQSLEIKERSSWSCNVLCDLLLKRRKAKWNLFVLYNKKQTIAALFSLILKSFIIIRKSAIAHFGEHENTIWHNLLSIKHEVISLVAMRSKELWLAQINHDAVKLESNGLSWNENVQQKQKWSAKSWKNLRTFCHQSSLASRKACMFGKIAVAVNTEDHSSFE